MNSQNKNTDNNGNNLTNNHDDKGRDDFTEDVELKGRDLVEKVEDSEAAPYIDNTLIIDEEESKAIKRIIHKR
jgi:hypothetical protein